MGEEDSPLLSVWLPGSMLNLEEEQEAEEAEKLTSVSTVDTEHQEGAACLSTGKSIIREE